GELEKKAIYNEIAALEDEVRKYQDNGTKLMQLKQNELMRPLYAKLNEAIDAIAKANGYTQVLTSSGNDFAYIDLKYDITKLVLDKLGIKEPENKE
ncbi:MAG: OmpH family outer membrane protein, partial [Polaribacter sp.]|nr:OmpH family outer membrane protein [Polaribacter sp.]